ncbi:MAG TPA: L,D-transpeptidase family protein [Flavitalea sp.]|nr:L,D-transpeptidase family protein [Flavitalea sp.]
MYSKNFFRILFLFLVIAVIASCKSGNDKPSDSGEGNEAAEGSKKISKRDMSITRENAYNDLFLDSMNLEEYLSANHVDDTISRRMRSFYNARNYQFAWFSSDGLTEQARGFWNIHEYQTTYVKDTTLADKALIKKMDRLIVEEELHVNPADKGMLDTELKLTEHYIRYALSAYDGGYVKRKELERFIPRKKEDAMFLADSLLTKKHKDGKYFEDIHASYGLLKNQLSKYYQISKQGGWPVITTAQKSLKRGMTFPEIAMIKKRLLVTGDLTINDTSQNFNDTLENGVKSFQFRHGFTPDGVITAALIREMNIPVDRRIQQLLLNMNRVQWMPAEPKGRLILVNIPEFVLHVRDGKNKVFDMNVVVGKEGHNTMMFSGDLNQIVFSPYWNVPESIVEKEILPSIEKNPNYLESQDMEITGNEGGFPVIRQKPGDKNSLGKVKFLFPNSFDIYFHDTPAKSLFNKDKRAYSHGCIRLAEPVKMANYLLKDQSEWTPEKVDEAMNSGKERFVKLKDPVPVFISYYTAWVDEKGLLHFAEDIYGHDANLVRKMFVNGGQPLAVK